MAQRDKTFHPPGAFINHLREQGLEVNKSPESNEGYEVHYLNLSQLRIDAGVYVPFIVPTAFFNKKVGSEDVANFLEDSDVLSRSLTGNVAILVIGTELGEASEQLQVTLRAHSLALLDKGTIDRVYKEYDPGLKRKALVNGLIESLGLISLSPYKSGKPASGPRFFGRDRILHSVLSGRKGQSFTFIGNRRVGKTSLLNQIKLSLILAGVNAHMIDIYGSIYNSTGEVLTTILAGSGREGARQAARLNLGGVPYSDYPRRIHQILKATGQQLIVFFDEVDHVLEFDELQEWELFNLLRAIEQDDNCRFFFAGFRRTREAKDRTDVPLFNFTYDQEVRRLSREETLKMVELPFEMLGIDITEDISMTIYRETGGHPELIQIFCEEIVNDYAESGYVPSGTDLHESVLAAGFQKKVWGAFMASSTAYERLACYLLVRRANEEQKVVEEVEFTDEQVDEVLRDADLELSRDDLFALVRNLELGGVFDRSPGARRFQFSVPQLARACQNLNLDFEISKALSDIKRHRDLKRSLLGGRI